MVTADITNMFGTSITTFIGEQSLIVLLAIAILIIWIKGTALWKACKLNEKGWFWALLLINTMGILPAIYLYIKRDRRI